MFLVAGVKMVSPISFVEGSAGRAGLVAPLFKSDRFCLWHATPLSTAVAQCGSLSCPSQLCLWHAGVLGILLSILGFCGWGYEGCGRLEHTCVYLGYWVFTSCCIWVSPLPMQVQHTYVSVLLLSWQPWERWFFWAALGEPQPQGLDTLLFISLPIGYLAPDHIFKVHLDIYRFHSALVYRHSY